MQFIVQAATAMLFDNYRMTVQLLGLLIEIARHFQTAD